MQTKISARHGHLSPDAQEKIREKVEKLRRLYDRVTSIEVTVDLEHREGPSVELRVSVERTEDFMATVVSTGVMPALDGAVDKIEQQLRKHKSKRRERRSQGLGKVEVPTEPE